VNAFDWTSPHFGRNDEPSVFRFGLSRSLLAADLRRLADMVEREDVIVHDAQTAHQVFREDWTKTVVTLTLAGRHEVAP
jgi:hypothetical protein